VSGGSYLAAAYAVVLAAVCLYVLLIALKLARLERDLSELTRFARRRRDERAPEREEARIG
jgi:hypothetical protein